MGLAYFFFYGGLVVSLIGVIKLFQIYKLRRKALESQKRYEKMIMEEKIAFENAPILEKLKKIEIGNLIVHWEKNYQIVGKMKLIEMTWDEHDNHLETGRYFPVLSVDDRKALFSMPKGEGSEIIWFFLQRQNIEKPLTPFFLGTDENPGPAMQFADSDQMADVFFSLPHQQEQWKMVDVGSFFFEAKGGNFVEGKGEVRHILAQSQENTKRYMLYFDLLEGQGSNALYIGDTLNPETEIEYILRS
jgi:hypothetical protein